MQVPNPPSILWLFQPSILQIFNLNRCYPARGAMIRRIDGPQQKPSDASPSKPYSPKQPLADVREVEPRVKTYNTRSFTRRCLGVALPGGRVSPMFTSTTSSQGLQRRHPCPGRRFFAALRPHSVYLDYIAQGRGDHSLQRLRTVYVRRLLLSPRGSGAKCSSPPTSPAPTTRRLATCAEENRVMSCTRGWMDRMALGGMY